MAMHDHTSTNAQTLASGGQLTQTLKKSAVPTADIRSNLPHRRYRPELHGVRGLAILGVVVFHLFGNGRVSGGIDIFLTISGFLFTAMLLREVTEKGGVVNLARYLGRLFRRIVAPAAIVIAVTVVVGLAIFPVTQHSQLWSEALASLLYFENVELINSQLAYEAAGQDISPVQHFWSLSIQGQFYLVMPLVALGAFWLARTLKTNATRIMTWLLVLVLVSSLVFAVYVGSYAQDEAYLMTRTRAWQFAFGGLLAIFVDRIHLSSKIRFVLGYIGLGLILSVGFVLNGAELFPGPWALWPLAGFGLVLLGAPGSAEDSPHKWSAPKLLSNPVFNWIGDHAYALYLWHWPLLIFYLAIREREAVGIRGAAVIFGATVVLAAVTHWLVEKPLDTVGKKRRGPRLDWTSLSAGIAVMAIGVLVALPNLPKNPDGVANSLDFDQETHPGALSVSHNLSAPNVEAIPEITDLHNNHPDYVHRRCQQTMGDAPGTDEISVCDDPEKPDDPTARVVLAGGSHSGHWEATIRALGQQHDWEVLVVTKSGCVLQDGQNPQTSMCQGWNENFVDWVADNDVDLVITPGSRISGEDSGESIQNGAQTRWEQITDAGTDMLLVRGTPRPVDLVGECLAEGNAAEDCGPTVGDTANPNPIEAENLPAGAQTVDMNPYICPMLDNGADAVCTAELGNVIVWYDGSHLSPEYAYTLAPAFEDEMSEVFPEYVD